jgi:hypothetical protein
MERKELRLTLSQREKLLRQAKEKLVYSKENSTVNVCLTSEETIVLINAINNSLVVKPQVQLRGQGFLGKNTKERYLLIKEQ